jgi:anthranilate phosphoribosyltransferase
MEFKPAFESLVAGKPLSLQQNEDIFAELLNGQWAPEQIAATLAAMRALGENSDQLYAGAREMRRRCIPYNIPSDIRPIADNCGTGGDGSDTFNISTAAAFVAASVGVRVFKHGNRSVSSLCGSSDLLAELGFPLDLTADRSINLFRSTGLSFIFAPSAHPNLKSVMPVRKSLGVRTIFNLLGPLANPTFPDVQVIGVARPEILKPMADALAKLCPGNFAVVCSQDGLDEISTDLPTQCLMRLQGQRSAQIIAPSTLGVRAPLSALKGGDSATNAKIFHDVLSGKLSPHADAVCLNAAILIWLCKSAGDFATSFSEAQSSLRSGACKKFFDNWLQAIAKA